MSFQFALDSLKEGKRVMRFNWKNHYITILDNKIRVVYTNGHSRWWEVDQLDILANDWEIVNA